MNNNLDKTIISNQEPEFFDTKDIVVFEPSKMLNVPSPAIHIENNISLLQKKIWFELVFYVFPKMGTQRRYSIPLRKIRELLGWSESTSSDSKLKDALHGLNQTAIKWNIFGKDKKKTWQSFPLLAGCEIPDNSGICNFEFSSFLEDRFLAMGEEAYVKIDLIISRKFQSKYALSIYCLALDYLMLDIGYSEKKFSLEEIKRYLGIKDGEYKLVGHFNDRVIKPVEDEINKTSDMNIEIKPFKEGNKIAGYKLCMSLKQGRAKEYLDKKNKLKALTETNMNEKNKKEYIQPTKKPLIQIQNEQLKKFFAKYSIATGTDSFQEKLKEIQEIFEGKELENYLVFLMDYTEVESNKGTIKNIAGFFVSIFKEDIQLDNYLIYQKDQKQKQSQKDMILERNIRAELEKKYISFLSDDFQEYINQNDHLLVDKMIQFCDKYMKTGDLAYDRVIALKMAKGFSIEVYRGLPRSQKSLFIARFRDDTAFFGYKEPTFLEWKEKYVTQELLDQIREEQSSSNKRI